MCPRPDVPPVERTDPAEDGGFSLVEVLVAMMLFAAVALASLTFLITGLSATGLARSEAVAKNLNQERLEGMRNLPFYRHVNVSTVPDLLDVYYTSTAMPAVGVDATGFVAATAPRSVGKGDPATGAFFRRVFPAGPAFPGFTQRVATQFLRDGTTVLADPQFVSTSTGAAGLPPSTAVAVRVTTLWTSSGGAAERLTVDTQITDTAVKAPLVTLQARLSTLRFTGVLPSARELVTEAGVLNLDGASSSTTVASAMAQGATAGIADGSRVQGATGTVSAPPASTATVAPSPVQVLNDGSHVAGFAGTSVTGLSVSAAAGQPGAGTTTAPVTAVLHGGASGGDYLSANNQPSPTSPLGLTAGSGVRATSAACDSGCAAVRAAGSLGSTGGPTHAARASLEGAVAGTLAVLPTVDSPDGVVQVTLDHVAVTCASTPTTVPRGAASITYSGTVRYRTWDTVAGYGYSQPVAISSTNPTDPLAQVPMSTIVGRDSVGNILRLSHYVRSWSSLSSSAAAAATIAATDGTAVSVSIPGVFTFASQPLRAEAESTVGLQLGAASCTAADRR